VKKGRVLSTPVQLMSTETGSVRVSTPEATALDLVRYARVAGYLDHVATVLRDLAEPLDPDRLVEAVRLEDSATVQRLGYLLEKLGFTEKVERLREHFATRRPSPVLLRPGTGGRAGPTDPRWRVIVNDEVESDE
jgi:predicted transcriptional regulator of viral defense system